tara:strand:+ start:97 stop:363 length:267 start_codon:yes stop_codon:yes gene_type:complete
VSEKMIKKITTSMTLLKKGKVVADPAKWKSRQITATVLTGVIWSAINAAEAFGYAIPVDAETVDAVAVGVLALVNFLLTLSTSEKVGM